MLVSTSRTKGIPMKINTDRTVDPIILQRANETRFGLEVWLNVQVTTMVVHRLPESWAKDAPITDLVTITDKYRMTGVIQ